MRLTALALTALALLPASLQASEPTTQAPAPPSVKLDEMGALERGAALAEAVAASQPARLGRAVLSEDREHALPANDDKGTPTVIDIRVTAIGSTGIRCCSSYIYEVPSAKEAEALANEVSQRGLWVAEDGIRYIIPASRIYLVTLYPIQP